MKINDPCSLETARALAALGYDKPTSQIWDRHSPKAGENASTKTFAHESCFSSCKLCESCRWKLSPSQRSYDFTCCLRAPSDLAAALFLLRKSITNLWG